MADDDDVLIDDGLILVSGKKRTIKIVTETEQLLEAENARLRAALAALVEEIDWPQWGEVEDYCPYCLSDAPAKANQPVMIEHKPDCPYAAAVRLLEELGD